MLRTSDKWNWQTHSNSSWGVLFSKVDNSLYIRSCNFAMIFACSCKMNYEFMRSDLFSMIIIMHDGSDSICISWHHRERLWKIFHSVPKWSLYNCLKPLLTGISPNHLWNYSLVTCHHMKWNLRCQSLSTHFSRFCHEKDDGQWRLFRHNSSWSRCTWIEMRLIESSTRSSDWANARRNDIQERHLNTGLKIYNALSKVWSVWFQSESWLKSLAILESGTVIRFREEYAKSRYFPDIYNESTI